MLISLLTATKFLMFIFDNKPMIDVGLRLTADTLVDIKDGIKIPFYILGAIFVLFYLLGFGSFSFIYSEEKIYNFLWAIPYFLLVGFNEELLFRGYLFQKLIEGFGVYFAIILFSILFGLAHYYNPHIGMLSMINIIIAGIFFSVAYIKTRSLWLPITMHFVWNFSQGMIFGFPVSGNSLSESFIEYIPSGPGLITGGDFGPEGGLVVTLLLGIATIYLFYRNNRFDQRI